MNANDNTNLKAGAASLSHRTACGISLLICGLLMLSGCTSRPIEETVTTSASRSAAIAANSVQPVAVRPHLPVRDADLEAAGDRIAEAITHLDRRRRGGHEAALRALGQAEAAMNRALRAKQRDERASRALHAAIRDIETAQRAVQHGASDTTAAKQLVALNNELDDLAMQPPPQTDAASDDQTQLP
ncbi:MAG: hypothetical protein ABR577_16865 [Pyrinomonadaceae bacterium]